MAVRYGLVGCGAVASHHISAIRQTPDAEFAGAADVRDGAAEAFCAEHGGRVFPSFEKMIESPDVDAVCILTPSGLHARQTILAAEAGKHVLVEKPLALTPDEADAVSEAVDKCGGRVGVVSQYRFMDSYRRTRAALEEGLLGRLVTCDASMKFYRAPDYYGKSPWRGTWAMDGGGALMNQGIHGIDSLISLAGPVRTVFGIARTLMHDIEVEDTAVAALEYESGAIGYIQGTTSVYPGFPRRLSFSGTRGTITMCEQRIVEWDIEGCEKPDDLMRDGAWKTGARDPMAIDAAGHLCHIRDLTEAILTGRDPIVTCREARKAIVLIHAIYESSRTGRPVDLSRGQGN